MPVEVDSQGLMSALEILAARTAELGRIECTFACPQPVPVEDNQTAMQLYLIAQEAVEQCTKHARAHHVKITLSSTTEQLTLAVEDDGSGIGEVGSGGRMGLKIMHYRADLIGARLSVERRSNKGTRVKCELPWNGSPAKSEP